MQAQTYLVRCLMNDKNVVINILYESIEDGDIRVADALNHAEPIIVTAKDILQAVSYLPPKHARTKTRLRHLAKALTKIEETED